MNYKDWFWLRQKAAFSHPRLNDIIEDGKEYYRVGFSDGATWERNRSEQAYTDLKQQADMLYEALEYANEFVCRHEGDLRPGTNREWCDFCSSWVYPSDWEQIPKLDKALKTYESFIKESEK